MIRLKKSLFFGALLASVALANCVKEKAFFPTETGDPSRKQIVTIAGAENAINVIARDVNPSIDTFVVITLRRSPSTQAELNSPLTVKLTLNSALITTYNTANRTNYQEVPGSAYTILGDLNAITFQPGESAKEIRIRLNKSTLSLSNQYALGFTIAEVGNGGQINPDKKNALYSIGIKNQYDGKYVLKGQFYHPTVANQGFFTFDKELHTSGPNSVKMYWELAGGYAHGWTANGSPTYFGAQEPNYTIDPVTNKVTVQNVAPGAVTFYTMAPGYDSRYDPVTKTIYAKWGYNYSAGPVFNPATNREWTDTLIYVGPR